MRASMSQPPSERQLHELASIYEVGQALGTEHDLDRLLQLAAERTRTLLEVEGSAVIPATCQLRYLPLEGERQR